MPNCATAHPIRPVRIVRRRPSRPASQPPSSLLGIVAKPNSAVTAPAVAMLAPRTRHISTVRNASENAPSWLTARAATRRLTSRGMHTPPLVTVEGSDDSYSTLTTGVVTGQVHLGSYTIALLRLGAGGRGGMMLSPALIALSPLARLGKSLSRRPEHP